MYGISHNKVYSYPLCNGTIIFVLFPCNIWPLFVPCTRLVIVHYIHSPSHHKFCWYCCFCYGKAESFLSTNPGAALANCSCRTSPLNEAKKKQKGKGRSVYIPFKGYSFWMGTSKTDWTNKLFNDLYRTCVCIDITRAFDFFMYIHVVTWRKNKHFWSCSLFSSTKPYRFLWPHSITFYSSV